MLDAKKILIIRFSSFGDFLQSLSIPTAIKKHWPDATIHFITRNDFSDLTENHPAISHTWSLQRQDGFLGLWYLCKKLRAENYTHIYDAHNNLRSHFIGWIVRTPNFIRKTQYRWRRFLLFNFRINLYPKPFIGQFALLEPLKKWGIPIEIPAAPQLFVMGPLPISISFSSPKPIVGLSPSASYALKRWPIENWMTLIKLNPQYNFLLFGGPEDLFIEKIAASAPDRTINLAGKLTFKQTALAAKQCKVIISNDTGVMHIAEQFGLPCIALLGPAPFGFPGRSTTVIKERNLKCRPCSKHGQGPCRNDVFQRCLVEITPQDVSTSLNQLFAGEKS